MGLIAIDNSNLEEQIKVYKQAISKYDSAISKMKKVKNELASSWSGDSGVAFLKTWENCISDVEKEKSKAEQLIDLLKKIMNDASSQDSLMSSTIGQVLLKGGSKKWL